MASRKSITPLETVNPFIPVTTQQRHKQFQATPIIPGDIDEMGKANYPAPFTLRSSDRINAAQIAARRFFGNLTGLRVVACNTLIDPDTFATTIEYQPYLFRGSERSALPFTFTIQEIK